MISTGFGYGERENIANAYAKMYAPKRMNESCCGGKDGCSGSKCEDGAKKKVLHKLPTKHCVSKKTGSKLGVRKVLPFEKRDVKSSATKFTPKTRKVAESARHYCIADGDSTLCTNDIGESYFNKGGVIGETRIYESKISAMKDIKKVQSRRNPNSKYKVRACECIGESYQFVDNGHMVNEGLWDGIKSIGSGVWDATKAVGNTVGGVAKGAGNLLQGNFAQAGQDVLGGLKDAGGNLADAGKNIVGGAADATLGTASDLAGAAGGVVKAAGNALGGDFKQAGEELMGAGSQSLGAVADDAREADVGGAIAKGASALGNAAKTAGGAVLDGVKAVAGGVGSGLKAAGNAMQGNFKQAGQELGIGGGDAKQQQGQQAQQSAPTQPLTPEQEAAMKAGKGPLSADAAKKEAAANAAQKPPQAPSVPSLLPQSVQDAMKAGFETPNNGNAQQSGNNGLQAQVSQQQQAAQSASPQNSGRQVSAPQQGGQQAAGGDKAARKTQIQQQIAALQKELQSLG